MYNTVKPFYFTIFLISFLFLCACNEGGILKRDEKDGDKVFSVDSEDQEMNIASAKAQGSFEIFLNAFNKSLSDSSKSGFAVKMKFVYNEVNGEHMWVNELHEKQGKLLGVLDNDPIYVTSYKWGDTVEIKQREVSDWMYYSNDSLKGAYTVKVLYKYANAQEKKQMEDAYGPLIKE